MFSKLFKNMLISLGLFILYTLFYSIFIMNTDTIFAQILASLIIIAITSYIYKEIIIKNIKSIKKDFNIKLFLLALLLIIGSIIIDKVLIMNLGHDSMNNTKVIEYIKTYKYIYALYVVIIVPLSEEFMFRLPYNKNKNIITFIECVVIFTLLHMQSLQDFIFIVPYLLVVYGISINYFKTDNIFISYLIHLINNLINVLLLVW